VENIAVNTRTTADNRLDVDTIRKDFPILDVQVHGKHLCYFDNAATTQKPLSVINAADNYYRSLNANIHRGVHYLSEAATAAYEQSRVKIQKFLNAASEKEIIFTSGTTASINMVAQTFGRQNIGEGDEIIISHMEHHSNIVPWQLLVKEKKAVLKIIPISDRGELDIDAYKKLVTDRTKIVSIVYVSNSLGTINPVEEIISYAHSGNIPVLLDAAQAVNHFPVDVQKLDCDFLAFSGHKLFAPTGIGVLYGKKEILENMPPYMGGGDMISKVTFEETTFNELPYKLEAGTPNIEGVIGLGAAIDYLNKTGFDKIAAYEKELFEYAVSAISSIKGVNIIGSAGNRCSVISFTIDNIHPHDVGTFLDFEGIAIRTGHHCTQPVMQRYNIPATSRVSLSFYNTKEEIDILVNGIKKVIEVFG
jgi:cysteine desulfurase/selenocysteine lyase